MKHIKTIIHADGTCSVDAINFTDATCSQATQQILTTLLAAPSPTSATSPKPSACPRSRIERPGGRAMTKLRITPDGRIRGLWDDDVQLGELGVIRVRTRESRRVRQPATALDRSADRRIDQAPAAMYQIVHQSPSRRSRARVGARELSTR